MAKTISEVELRERFGNNLKIIRTIKRMTQDELAALSGVTNQSISYYETGKRNVTLFHAISIAAALGVELNYLLSENLYIGASNEND